MGRRVAVTGAAGQLGRQLVRAFSDAGDEVLALARPDFDITDASHLARLTAWRPDVVVNSAAWTDVDGCARDEDRAMRINGEAAGRVARAAADAGALIVQISTNEVFDGTLERPYVEEDEPNPINPYGASKLVGERAVAAASPRHVIVRTAWLYGRTSGFPERIRSAAERMALQGRELQVVADEWGNPTDVRWLAPAIERLVRGAAPGGDRVVHLAGWPPTSRYEWARKLVSTRDVVLTPIPSAAYKRDSRVPLRAILNVERARALRIPPGTWTSAGRP